MQFVKKYLLYILGVVIVLIGVFYYLNNSNTPTSLLTSSTSQNSPITQQLLNSLSSLHTITLDNAVFSDPVFTSLTDFGVQIAPENVGRGNPFAPFGAAPSSKKTGH